MSNTHISLFSPSPAEREEPVEEEAAPPLGAAKKETPVQYNYKNLLQEHVVKQGWTLPTYQTNKCTGGFSSVVSIPGVRGIQMN